MRLVLASTSPYRRELLARFGLPFDVLRPDVDESRLPGEGASALARRLAGDKAAAVAAQAPDAWVIGSDQVAELDDAVLGKPGGREAAIAQLQAMSGRTARFHTAVCLLGPQGAAGIASDSTSVRVRALTRAEIERYVDRETPYDCAGSFKCEGLGIVLFDAIESADPTGLIGLPLIATARLLREAGFVLP